MVRLFAICGYGEGVNVIVGLIDSYDTMELSKYNYAWQVKQKRDLSKLVIRSIRDLSHLVIRSIRDLSLLVIRSIRDLSLLVIRSIRDLLLLVIRSIRDLSYLVLRSIWDLSYLVIRDLSYLQWLDIMMHVSNTGHNLFQELVCGLQTRVNSVISKELHRKILRSIEWI